MLLNYTWKFTARHRGAGLIKIFVALLMDSAKENVGVLHMVSHKETFSYNTNRCTNY